TMGRTLWEAYLRLEKVEHTAQITLAAQQLGRVHTLSPQAVDKLTEIRRELLQREGRDLCDGCSVCLLGDTYQLPTAVSPMPAGARDEEALVQQIAQTVVSAIRKP
ncbi:hypothetical protein ACFLYD_01420, partial [Chloroflexota bacterium]